VLESIEKGLGGFLGLRTSGMRLKLWPGSGLDTIADCVNCVFLWLASWGLRLRKFFFNCVQPWFRYFCYFTQKL